MKRLRLATMAALFGLGSSMSAQGQDSAPSYPVKPIRIIIPLTASGPSDTIARIMSQKLAEILGQNVVIDNRPGASGMIGIEIGAKSPPDGYTLLLVSSVLSINPAIYKNVPYDFDRDLTAVSQLTLTPFLLSVHPSLPVKTVKDLIALAQARPGELNHASAGYGTGPHLAMELFARRTGIKIVQVVYKGGAPAMIGFLAGEAQVYLTNMVTALAHVRTGKSRALAVSTISRSPAAPDIPTIHESGVPKFNEAGIQGIVAPKGVSAEIIAKLHRAIVTAMRSPEVVRRLANDGSTAIASTPEQYGALIRSDTVKWKEIVRSMDLKAE